MYGFISFPTIGEWASRPSHFVVSSTLPAPCQHIIKFCSSILAVFASTSFRAKSSNSHRQVYTSFVHNRQNSAESRMEQAPQQEHHAKPTPRGIHHAIAGFVAKNAWITLLSSFSIVLGLSVVGLYYGEFSVTADNAGWQSRGTLVADRQTQLMLLEILQDDHEDQGLFQDAELWFNYTEFVQPGWEVEEEGGGGSRRRRLSHEVMAPHTNPSSAIRLQGQFSPQHVLPSFEHGDRSLQDLSSLDLSAFNTGVLEGCSPFWYFTNMISSRRLWPVWKIDEDSQSDSVFLSKEALRDICLAEEETQAKLEEAGLCERCSGAEDDTKCLPPFSLVLYARYVVDGGLEMNCEDLSTAWAAYTDSMPTLKEDLQTCANDMVADLDYDPFYTTFFTPDSCPPLFLPFFIDYNFRTTGTLSYTSSIFATEGVREVYDLVSDFGKGTDIVEGAYDTLGEDYVNIFVDDSVITDMALALASAAITMSAVLIHTRSIWLTVVGFFQIALSFPLAFFFYKFVLGITFFPFLNFIGVFILFALGADVIFVAVDKWKNARIDLTDNADVTEVAMAALPDAAGAMFLTTFTTAVAFFATSVCPVAPSTFRLVCSLAVDSLCDTKFLQSNALLSLVDFSFPSTTSCAAPLFSRLFAFMTGTATVSVHFRAVPFSLQTK